MANVKTGKTRPVGRIELHGIINGTIPVCDEFGPFDKRGLAMVKKDGKVGLVNRIPEVVIEPTADSIEFLNDHLLLVYKYDWYYLYTTKGDKACELRFLDKEEAKRYALILR